MQRHETASPDRIIQQAVRYLSGGVMSEGGYDHPLYTSLLERWLTQENPPADHPLLLRAVGYYIANCEDVAELKHQNREIKQRVIDIVNGKPQKRWQNEHWREAARLGTSFKRTLNKSKKGRNGTYILQAEQTTTYPYFSLRLIQPPSRVRGCTHDELGTLFCPVCGARMWEDNKPSPEIRWPKTHTTPNDVNYTSPDGTYIEVSRITHMMCFSIAQSSKSPAQFFDLGPAHEWMEKNVPPQHQCDGDDCPACEYGDP